MFVTCKCNMLCVRYNGHTDVQHQTNTRSRGFPLSPYFRLYRVCGVGILITQSNVFFFIFHFNFLLFLWFCSRVFTSFPQFQLQKIRLYSGYIYPLVYTYCTLIIDLIPNRHIVHSRYLQPPCFIAALLLCVLLQHIIIWNI